MGKFRDLAFALGVAFLGSGFGLNSSFAGIEQAPPSFSYGNGTAVYVDFETANYHLVYDLDRGEAWVESEIFFRMPKGGFPLFDLVPEPVDLQVDEAARTSTLIDDPSRSTVFRVVNQALNPGRHRMTMRHRLERNVDFRDRGVASAFWMTDLNDRGYLEQYLPSSFEYDPVQMNFRVEIIGQSAVEHRIFSNGKIKNPARNLFDIEFPKFFTVSSAFFHLLPASAVPVIESSYASVDGRKIPIQVYSAGPVDEYMRQAKEVLRELETDYGPFPHPKLVIYGAGDGGMEYSGATVTSLWALGHELFHSYNARAVMPAQGNAGWIDEAIASWRDIGYKLRSEPGGKTSMAGHSKWTRMTDDAAYTQGRDFLAWIGGRMSEKGLDLKVFLREYFNRHFYTTVTTELFRDELSQFSGMDLRPDFRTYVYGGSGNRSVRPRRRQPNEFHPDLTPKELNRLLWPRRR